MKLTKSRSCVLRNLPPAPKSRTMNSVVKRRMPRPLLRVNNLQKRRFQSTLEVKIEGCITVGDLKRSIAIQNNLSVIALLYRGVPLDDARHLENLLPDLCLGPPRFAVHTGVRPRMLPGGVSVNVLSLTRKTFQVTLHSLDSTLLELKEAIQGYEGMSLDQIALTCAGKQLTQDHYTLRQYNVEPGCTVHLVGRLRGGGGKIDTAVDVPQAREFADLENCSLLCKIELSAKAPVWRSCKEGLNVEGECRNKDCIAFQEMVIDPLEFTVFNLEEEAHCPCCEFEIQPVTCAFRKCLWMFEGRKAGSCSVYVQSGWMKAGNKYERFDEAADGQTTAEWSSLIITAKELPSTRNMSTFHGHGECPICYEKFKASTSQCTGKCGHAFHRVCVMAWQMKGNTTCPMCRNSLE